MKKLFSILLSLTLLLPLSACTSQQVAPTPQASTSSPKQEWSYTFSDSTGQTVTLSHRPRTVAVLFSSYAQIWELAGGSISVTVGESIERGFAGEEALLVDTGAGKTIDLELLLSAQPDFVIGSADIAAQVDACRLSAQAGIPSALFQVDTFADYLNMLNICTQITGDTPAYMRYGTDVAKEIDTLLSQVEEAQLPKKSILFIRAGSQYSSTKAKRAPENFVCTMLEELGAHNIADDAPLLLDGLSLEEILLRDPDYIFLTTMGSREAAVSYINDLFAQQGWRDLTAVRNGNYTFLDKELFHFKPNAQWGKAYSTLAQLLYPELNTHD